MEARKTLGRLLELAYAKPKVQERTKPSETPGWLFDATVVALFIIGAVGYFTV